MIANSQVETTEVINFGKFKGTALVDLNHGYVNWLLSLDNLNEGMRKSLEALPWVQEARERERAFQKRKAHCHGFKKLVNVNALSKSAKLWQLACSLQTSLYETVVRIKNAWAGLVLKE